MERRKPAAAGYQLPVKKKAEKPAEKALTKLYDSSEFDGDQTKDNAKTKNKPSKKQHKTPKAHRERTSSGAAKNILKALVIIILLAGIGVGVYFLLKPSISRENLGKEPLPIATADQIYYSPLSGLEVDNPSKINQAATCIMIENSPDARPQSGLDQAGVVYEAIAEGGITRFMAIFQETKPQFIGPVRSVRMTYAQFAKPYHCSIAHVGGADNALNLIRNNAEFRDIDQFFNDGSYWRDNSRWAPHNVYTSFDRLDALNTNLGYTTSEFNGFTRIKPDTRNEAKTDANTIRITLSSPTYNPIFSYDAETNTYLRSHTEDGAHMVTDANGNQTQIAPTVVVAIKVNTLARDGSAEGYADYQTMGSNDAYIFQDGTVIQGKWERADENAELKFVDSTGAEIALNRGQVWITAFPAGSGAISWE